MKRLEIRHQVSVALRQAEEPLSAAEIAAQTGLREHELGAVLSALVSDGLVVSGDLVRGRRGPQYFWAAWWAREAERQAAAAGCQLAAAVDALPRVLAINSGAVLAFHDYIIRRYSPPATKRFLVFFQCSVRRPFSKSPSHASMRRAVAVATGHDPARAFELCPAHVVVLASNIGPVPYELEDVYPANVGGGGVKHFGDEHYHRVKPVLAQRMAAYIAAHGSRYERMATFTDGRYADVMAAARSLAGVDFPILPQRQGAQVVRMGTSVPRTYWQKCWIQLCLEIMTWLPQPARRAAEARLEELAVVWRQGTA
jgi:hypothetical protein